MIGDFFGNEVRSSGEYLGAEGSEHFGDDSGESLGANGDEWDMTGVEFAGGLPGDVLDDTPLKPSTPEAKAESESEVEDSPNFFGPDREMQGQERSLLGDMNEAQDETFRHQRQVINEMGGVMEEVFGRSRGERIYSALEETYAINNRRMQEHNEIVADYLNAKYPNRFGGSDAVAKLPSAEVRARKAERISDDFMDNANRRSSAILGGFEEVTHEVNRAMEGDPGTLRRHLNAFSEAVATFEQHFARLEKDFMDAPSAEGAAALRDFAAEHAEDLGRMRHGFAEDSYNFGQGVGRNMEDILGMMARNQKNDLGNRCQTMIDYVIFKAGAAIPEDEISRIKAVYGATDATEGSGGVKVEDNPLERFEGLF